MAKAVGGYFKEASCNHPTLGYSVFYPMSGEAANYDLGGVRTGDDETGVDGAGNPVYQLTQNRWFWEGPVSCDMNDDETMVKLTALAADPQEGDWTFTHINGTVFAAKGKPVGNVQVDAQAATIQLKVSGGKTMKKIA